MTIMNLDGDRPAAINKFRLFLIIIDTHFLPAKCRILFSSIEVNKRHRTKLLLAAKNLCREADNLEVLNLRFNVSEH